MTVSGAERVVANLLSPLATANLFERLSGGQWDVIVRYHSVGRRWDPPHAIPTDTLREQLRYLSAQFETVPLGELCERPRHSRPRVALTFDDGYRGFVETVVPLLREFDVPASVFVSPAFLNDGNRSLANRRHKRIRDTDGPIFMTDTQLQRVDASPLVTVGNHTRTHPDLSTLNVTELRTEIGDAATELADLLGHEIDSFCYPYGGYEPATFDRIRSVVEAHHDMAVTTIPGHVPSDPDYYQLPRVEARVDRRLFRFRTAAPYSVFTNGYTMARRLAHRL